MLHSTQFLPLGAQASLMTATALKAGSDINKCGLMKAAALLETEHMY